ncbi:hypothetical protein QAD02_010892 [Eretmocerus hayati]|uniref:Uncharacterized protein n=1 Tax=Eretmocerus hayati TaxID=131215 RepID=A0ACC2NWB9_9HYME|nr:hypothetical protein QAD02_010892 [Eretmocerus hayati]
MTMPIYRFRLSPRSRKQNCGTKRADEVGQDQQRPLKKRICSASSSSVPTVWVKVIPDSREEWEVIGASGQKLKIPYHSGYPISKVFTCEICKAHFPSKYLLEKHRSDGHVEPGPSQPKTKSTENFDIVNYNGYQKTSTGKFTCNFCSHTALYQASMKKHVAQKHGDVGKNDVLPMDVSNSNREVAPMDSWLHRKTPPTHDDAGTWPNEMLNVIIKEEHSEVETEVARNILRNESDKLQRICPYCPYMTTMCTPFRNHVKQEHPEIWLKNNFEDLVKENVTNVESEDDESDEGNDGNDSQQEQNQEHPKEVADSETNTILIQKFKCPYCPTELTESSAMISHVACVHHKSEWKRDSDKDKGLVRTGYACYHCDFVGCNIKSLGKHGLRKHQGLDMIIGEIPVTRFDCDICSYQCEGLKTMTLHIESHKPKPNAEGVYQCKICDFDTNLIEVLGRHMSINHLKPVVPMSAEMVTCNSCEFSCINKRVMDWHQRQHELPPKEACQMVICDECGYFSYNKTRLARHITRKHRDILDGSGPATEPGNQRKTPKKYVRPVRDSIPCEICGWLAKNNSVLKYHIIRKHTDTKQYECDQCDKKYNLKADLTSHKKYKHSDTKEFVCDVCGRVCNTANGLYGHQKYAHFKTEFECQVCHRRLASQANLDEHIQKQHEERQLFMCEECGKVFHEARKLRTHMRVHTGVRPYECSVCKKSFGKQTGLRQHLLTHSGQRPYVCDVCGKAFTQKTGLICHRKSHPGPLPPLPPVPKGVIDRILNDMQAEARYLNNCQ